jgi:hypothetical protein
MSIRPVLLVFAAIMLVLGAVVALTVTSNPMATTSGLSSGGGAFWTRWDRES